MVIDGTWNLKLQTPMGERSVVLRLAAAGATLTGAMVGQAGETPLLDGSVDGEKAAWSVMFSGAMGEMKLDFEGTVDGDTLGGTVQFGGFGTGTFDGTRG